MTRSRALVAIVAVVVLTTVGGGCANETSAAGPAGMKLRTIDITMNEMSFSPDRLTVRVGETVTFKIRNAGTVRHEAVFGDQAAQDAAMALGSTTVQGVTPESRIGSALPMIVQGSQ